MPVELSALSEETLTALRPLARQFPNLDSALAEIAGLTGELSLPTGTIHVISDIHGDDMKLRHVINNVSGMLRPLVKRLFSSRMNHVELQDFLSLLFYPRETLQQLEPRLQDPEARQAFCRRTLADLFYIINVLARRYTVRHALEAFPAEYRELFAELLREVGGERGPRYYDALIDPLVRHYRALYVLRLTVRVVRHLAIDELVIGGDCWDRGPRGDRVVDYLMRQPRLAFVWGNHDVAWLGACLGCGALVAHVVRISLRYRRLEQLEEGYAIPLEPLEQLARNVYTNDPARCFVPKGPESAGRPTVLLARMQKAAAIMQFKLEGQMIARNPHWQLDNRRLLHTINPTDGTIFIDGKTHALRDRFFPTLDPKDPYALSKEEMDCLVELRRSFMLSEKLQKHQAFLLKHGSMALHRDDILIFHGCVPVDDQGDFLAFEVDGKTVAGKALFEAIDRVLARILDEASTGLPEAPLHTRESNQDLCWYLWCGPRSPLFGKDKIATLEIDLVEDPTTHTETKNPYFSLIHDVDFCDRILSEFGVAPARGLIVNGHVPVKIEKGESPMKRSGKAITIDGAFSAAYGDHGYTLVLESNRILLATHHHFESVEAAVREGKDIIPTISVLRTIEPHRIIADTEKGTEIRRTIWWLEQLVLAYREKKLRQI
jgi:fructose-1,6-bisphosphatase-3